MGNKKIYSVVDHLTKLQDKIDQAKNELFIQEAKIKKLEKEADDIMVSILRHN